MLQGVESKWEELETELELPPPGQHVQGKELMGVVTEWLKGNSTSGRDCSWEFLSEAVGGLVKNPALAKKIKEKYCK